MAKTRRQIQKQIAANQPQPLPDEFIGMIGDRNGDWDAGGNNIYVRELASGQTITVKNLVVPPYPGRLVKVQRQGGTLYVIGYWGIYGENETQDAFIPPHDHRWPDPNFTPIEAAQVMAFNIWPYDGFTVQIFGGVFPKTDGTFGHLANQTFDLSSYQPSAGALIVHFQYDESGTVSVVSGTAVDAKGALTVADIPESTEISMRIAVRLYDGQESVRRDGVIDDFYDWRFGKPARVKNALAIDGYDVDMTTEAPVDGDVLMFDGCGQAWFPTSTVFESLNALAIDGIVVDNTTSPPSDGQVLTYDVHTDTYRPENSGGGGGGDGTPIFQRVLSTNLTLDDGECMVITQYLDLATYNLTLDGDATLEIL